MADYESLSKIISGDEYHIKKFVKDNKQEINETDKWGLTRLMVACRLGSTRLINKLLEFGAEVNKEDKNKNSALHYAVRSNQPTLVTLLASKGADVKKCNAQGNSLLHLAVETGSKDMVEAVVRVTKNKKEQINKRNVNGDTPLLLACHRGNTEVIQQLLLYKPDVNLENKHNNTPLHWACSWGFKDIVEQLLLFDADVNRKDIYHYTPLHWACDSGHLEVVQQLLWWSKSCSESSLTKADVNAVDSDDVTALHVACGLGYENIIKELQIPELKVNAKDKKGENTPLHWACRSGQKQAVQQLLNSEPDVNLTNVEGNTPLHLAVLNQRYDVVAFLLSQPDVKVNTKNIKETTPLLNAVTISHFGILQKLVSHGAELDALDAVGNNCLHLAVKKDKFHSEEETGEHLDYFWKRLGLEKEDKLCGTVIACYLGRLGANFHQKNNSGKTPVDLIVSDYQEKIKELFPPFCLLCGVKEVSVTLLPCGDKVICRKCYEDTQPHVCPKCQKPIESYNIRATSKVEDKEDQQVAHSAIATPKAEDKEDQQVAHRARTTPKAEDKEDQQVAHSARSNKAVQTSAYPSESKPLPDESSMPTEKNLDRVATRLGSKWMRVGRELGVRQVELDIIRHDYPYDTEEQSFQMLIRWYMSCDPMERTLETLIEALERCECYEALKCLIEIE